MFALVQIPEGKEASDFVELFAEFGFKLNNVIKDTNTGRQRSISGPQENFRTLLIEGKKHGLVIWRDPRFSARDYIKRMNRRNRGFK